MAWHVMYDIVCAAGGPGECSVCVTVLTDHVEQHSTITPHSEAHSPACGAACCTACNMPEGNPVSSPEMFFFFGTHLASLACIIICSAACIASTVAFASDSLTEGAWQRSSQASAPSSMSPSAHPKHTQASAGSKHASTRQACACC